MNPIFSSATELARAILAGTMSAVEVLEAHLAQIDNHNPALNAIVTLEAESARRCARAADESLARGEVWGPLHGVPFTLKDGFATKGVRSTAGFPSFDHIPDYDSAPAARLKDAGAILMGKTNVSTLLGEYQTHNPIFGRTNNPWNPAYTPSGSSGGAAAAVAAGLTPFDIGSDLGGSIRIPAHFCGLFGLKPTETRVSLTGVLPSPHPLPRSIRIMATVGPIARTVDDIELLYTLIAGPDGRDTSVPPVPVERSVPLALNTLRIAYAPTFAGVPVSSETRHAIETLAQQLEAAGAVVEAAPLPHFDVGEAFTHIGGIINMMVGAFQPQDHPPTLDHYLTELHIRDQSIVAWEQFFQAWDVLLCPTAMIPAYPHHEPGTPLLVDGQPVDYLAQSIHTTLFNYTGHPALALPYTRSSDGLPLGVQLVSKRWGEAKLLSVAKSIATVTGAFQRPTGY
jgi:amidase